MNALLSGLGRLLGLQVVLRMTADLPPRAARRLLAATVVAVNAAPVLAVLTGAIGYGDVWLWLALEVVTIYVWSLLRGFVAGDPGGGIGELVRSRKGLVFFAAHYGGFALVPFAVGLGTVLPAAPLRSPVLTVVVLGGLAFVAAGWAMARLLAGRVPLSGGDYARAYARMLLAYLALFVPLLAGSSRDGEVVVLGETRQAVLAVLVLLAKLALELVLVVGVTRRADGQLLLLGRPVVVVHHGRQQ